MYLVLFTPNLLALSSTGYEYEYENTCSDTTTSCLRHPQEQKDHRSFTGRISVDLSF